MYKPPAKYMTASDPDAFLGWKPQDRWPNHKPFLAFLHDLCYPCPVCRTHGGWNLQLNAFGPGKHFRTHCMQCEGYGWVSQANATCIHEYGDRPQYVGNCMALYECLKCHQQLTVDSSD